MVLRVSLRERVLVLLRDRPFVGWLVRDVFSFYRCALTFLVCDQQVYPTKIQVHCAGAQFIFWGIVYVSFL